MLLSAMLLVLSVFHGLFVFSMLRDPARLRTYVETSPKAFLWRKMLGVERAVELTRRVFLPLGAVVAGVLFLLAASALVSHLLGHREAAGALLGAPTSEP